MASAGGRAAKRLRVADIEDIVCGKHIFTETEVRAVRAGLLAHYDQHQRILPWRHQTGTIAAAAAATANAARADGVAAVTSAVAGRPTAHGDSNNVKGYAVWVSEIMLQQTQVATVIEYYKKWMTKWYYSRARRLHEGACKIMSEYDGQMPSTAVSLQKNLPGVGPYTAGAIASIAFGERAGVVDGNVIRVLSRLRHIGGDVTSDTVKTALWKLADQVVDTERPGDFNQALMEHGALICTPKSPSCGDCPVKECCHVHAHAAAQAAAGDGAGAAEAAAKPSNPFAMAKAAAAASSKPASATKLTPVSTSSDADGDSTGSSACSLCLPAGVTNTVESYPRKPPKKAPKEENVAVVVCSRDAAGGELEFLMAQRPKKGLLANMWEFPNGVFSPTVDAANAGNNASGTEPANSNAVSNGSSNTGGGGAGGGGSTSAESKEDSDVKEAIRRSLMDASLPVDAMVFDAPEPAAAAATPQPSLSSSSDVSAAVIKKEPVVSPFFTLQRSKAAGKTPDSTTTSTGKGKGKATSSAIANTKTKTKAKAKVKAKAPKKMSAAAMKAANMEEVARSDAASAAARAVLASSLGVPEAKLSTVTMQPCGAVLHIFSHIRHTYSVWSVDAAGIGAEHVAQLPGLLNGKWLSRADLLEAAVSTNMKKVFACVEKATAQQDDGGGAGSKKK